MAYTNVLIALKNLLQHDSSILTPIYRSNGPTNAAGDSLEYFVKDCFCGTSFQYFYKHQKETEYKKYLSFQGNPRNFPDFIIRGGIGVEPKKLKNNSESTLALNSSYPKDYITPNSQNIPKPDQFDNENSWKQKPVLYVVGNLNEPSKTTKTSRVPNQLITLWMAFGNTFIADNSVYTKLIKNIQLGIKGIKPTGASISTTSKELARLKGIDPLKHANLRVRGMYELPHPAQVFNKYVQHISSNIDTLGDTVTRVYLIMLKSDYDNLQQNHYVDLSTFRSGSNPKLYISDVKIPDPNNTTKNLDAKLFEAWTN